MNYIDYEDYFKSDEVVASEEAAEQKEYEGEEEMKIKGKGLKTLKKAYLRNMNSNPKKAAQILGHLRKVFGVK